MSMVPPVCTKATLGLGSGRELLGVGVIALEEELEGATDMNPFIRGVWNPRAVIGGTPSGGTRLEVRLPESEAILDENDDPLRALRLPPRRGGNPLAVAPSDLPSILSTPLDAGLRVAPCSAACVVTSFTASCTGTPYR